MAKRTARHYYAIQGLYLPEVHSFRCRDCRDSFVLHYKFTKSVIAADLSRAQKLGSIRHVRCPSWRLKP